MDHLVQEHEVHSLGWIGARVEYDPQARMNAFFDAVEQHGAAATAMLLDEIDLETAPQFTQVIDRARAGTLPDALVCATDQIAIALLDVLRDEGVEAPRDVRVVGFDGIQAARMSRPTLTTVRQPMELMGRIAAHLLLTDPGDGAMGHRTVEVEVGLRLGESCGCHG